MKVSELEGALLDRWVAKAMGFAHTSAREAAFALDGQADPCVFATSSGSLRLAKADSVTVWNPSTDWVCGGPIIEREGLVIAPRAHPEFIATMTWASQPYSGKSAQHIGSTPLIAAMRAFVASKFGEEVGDAPSVTG